MINPIGFLPHWRKPIFFFGLMKMMGLLYRLERLCGLGKRPADEAGGKFCNLCGEAGATD